jgi:hypothetical protein
LGHWNASPPPLYVVALPRLDSAPGPRNGLGEGVTASMPSAKLTPQADGVASVSTSVQPTLMAAAMNVVELQIKETDDEYKAELVHPEPLV